MHFFTNFIPNIWILFHFMSCRRYMSIWFKPPYYFLSSGDTSCSCQLLYLVALLCTIIYHTELGYTRRQLHLLMYFNSLFFRVPACERIKGKGYISGYATICYNIFIKQRRRTHTANERVLANSRVNVLKP